MLAHERTAPAQPFSQVTWAKGIDQKTGRPIVNPEANYGADAITISPGGGGAHNWSPMSFNPATGLVYIPTLHRQQLHLCGGAELRPQAGSDYGNDASVARSKPAGPAGNRTRSAGGNRAEECAGGVGPIQ
jgi:hypothetical protein